MYSGYVQQPQNLATKSKKGLVSYSKTIAYLLIIIVILTIATTFIVGTYYEKQAELEEYTVEYLESGGDIWDLTNDPTYLQLSAELNEEHGAMITLASLLGFALFILYIIGLVYLLKFSKSFGMLVKHNYNFKKDAGRVSSFLKFSILAFIISGIIGYISVLTWIFILVAMLACISLMEHFRELNAFDGNKNWFMVAGAGAIAFFSVLEQFNTTMISSIGLNSTNILTSVLMFGSYSVFVFGLLKFHNDMKTVNEFNIPTLSPQNQYFSEPYAQNATYPNQQSMPAQTLNSQEPFAKDVQEPMTQLGKEFCLNCGSKLDPNSQFCAHCGERIN